MEKQQPTEQTKLFIKELNPHLQDTQSLLTALDTNKETGLSQTEAATRLKIYGHNELAEEEKESLFAKIMEQFEDPMVKLLLIAAVISFVISYLTKDQVSSEEDGLPIWIEPAVIVLILIANGLIGLYQDYSAEKSVEMLKSLQSKDCRVLREDKWTTVSTTELVPGDIVRLATGESVPADCRLLSIPSGYVKIDESILTGESVPVSKKIDKLKSADKISAKTNMVFSGTGVAIGNCTAVVVGTGSLTELGIIKEEVDEATKEKKEDVSPLKKQLDDFGDFLAKIIGVICLLIWLISLPKFFDEVHQTWYLGAMYYFKQAVALGVAAIPEGLPAVITTCLALGTRRMVKKNALVRKLTKVETLGCTTVICSDKTGTLTRNEMFASSFGVIDGRSNIAVNDVDGIGYSPKGQITFNSNLRIKEENINLFALNCLLNQETTIIEQDGKFNCRGMPSEGALIALGRKIAKQTEYITDKFQKIFTFGFSSQRKMMSVIIKNKENNETKLMTKGNPKFVLARCTQYLDNNNNAHTLSEDKRAELSKDIDAMCRKGFRVFGLAYKEGKDLGPASSFKNPDNTLCDSYRYVMDPSNYELMEKEMIYLGFVCISDPAKKEVKSAIRLAKTAGIVIYMITGDNPDTALAVSKEINLVDANTPFYDPKQNLKDLTRVVYTGKELDNMDEKTKTKIISNSLKNKQSLIFAETSPKNKRKLVKAIAKLDEIVAMTGDGVNDAPALKQASIGIAMGINGTEVAKEASDLILLDDNFATIVTAVEEGRAIYANMKAFIRYMISSNIGEVVSIFLTSLMGIPEGFNSIQLLWVNLVTDGLPATALSFNQPDVDIMRRGPRRKDDKIVDSWIFMRYIIVGIYVGLATTGIFVYYYTSYDWADHTHSMVSYSQLSNWTKCNSWKDVSYIGFDNPCDYFLSGKKKASTLSLTVLVMIEMFNAFNAMSENQGLLQIGLFNNIWLWQAVGVSTILHCVILYVPSLARLFSTVPLDLKDWALVMVFTLPVIFIEEGLKYLSRKKEADKKKVK